MTEIESVIESRRSWPKLVEPAPDVATVRAMIRAALMAPDHGRLKPWRFLTISGAALEALGSVFAATADSEIQAQSLSKQPLRAPMILVAIARVVEGHKIPVVEQQVAVGCAVQNALLVAQAAGVGSYWRTGPMAYDASVQQALGLASDEEVIGFIYLGTPEGKVGERPSQTPEAVTQQWLAPGDCVPLGS